MVLEKHRLRISVEATYEVREHNLVNVKWNLQKVVQDALERVNVIHGGNIVKVEEVS